MASKSLELILELIVKDAGGDLAKITQGMDAIIKKANDLKSTAQLKDIIGATKATEQINALGVAMQKLVDFRAFSRIGQEASSLYSALKQMQGFKLDIDLTKIENSLEVVTKEAVTAYNTLSRLSKQKLDVDVTKVNKDLDLVVQKGRQVIDLLVQTGRTPLDIKTNNAEAKVDRVNRSVRQLRDSKAQLDKQTAASEERFRLLNTTLGNVANQFLFVRRVIIAIAGVNLGERVLEIVSSFDKLTLSMKGVFDTKAADELIFVRQTADRLGISITDLGSQWAKFAASVDPAKVSIEAMRDNFLAVAEAGARLGLSTDEINGALTALSQIASKGRLSMEELRQQLGDRLPGAVRIAADALGLTQTKLFSLIEQGKIASDTFLNAFPAALRKSFGTDTSTRIETVGAAVVRLQNAFKEFLNAVVRSGALDVFIDIIKRMGERFKDPAFIQGMQEVAATIAQLAKAAAAAAPLITKFLLAFVAFKAFKGIADGISAISIGIVNLGAAYAKATAPVVAYTGAQTAATAVTAAQVASTATLGQQVLSVGKFFAGAATAVGLLTAAYIAGKAVADNFVDQLIKGQEKAGALAEALREAASNQRLAKFFSDQATALKDFAGVTALTAEQIKALTQEQAQQYRQGVEGAQALATAQEKATAASLKAAQEELKAVQLRGDNTKESRAQMDALIKTIVLLKDQQEQATKRSQDLAAAMAEVEKRSDASGKAINDNADAINRLVTGAAAGARVGEALAKIDLSKLSKDAKAIIQGFNDAREKGEDFAKAIDKAVPKNWLDGAQKDLADTTNAIAAMIQEGLIPASVAAEELAKDLNKLDADKIAAFGVRAQAAFEMGTISAQALDVALNTELRATLNKLGIDADFAGSHITKAFAELTSNFANLAGNVKATGAQIKEGLDISIQAAKTKEELQIIKDTVESLGLATGKFASDLADSLTRLDDKIRLTAATMNSALGDSFQRLGVQSKAAIQAMADQAVIDFNRIKASGQATALELEAAFRKMAEEVTKANNGIPPISLKVQAIDANAFDVLVAMAQKASERVKKAIQDAIPLADTKEKLRLLAEGIEGAFDRGRISIQEFAQLMFTVGQNIRDAIAKPVGEVAAVVEKFGFKTKDMLKATADNAKEAFDVMRTSGEFTTQELAKAAQQYKDAYIAANDGVVDAFDPVLEKAQEVIDKVNATTNAVDQMSKMSAPVDVGNLRDKRNDELQTMLSDLTKAYRAIGIQNVQDLQIIQEIQKELNRKGLEDAEVRRKAMEDATTQLNEGVGNLVNGVVKATNIATDNITGSQRATGAGAGGGASIGRPVNNVAPITINLNGSSSITPDEVKRKVIPAVRQVQLRRT
jgi:tape measure domain-containing protein